MILRLLRSACSALSLLVAASCLAESPLVNSLQIPGNTMDLSGLGNGVNLNRFGAFSDLYFHPGEQVFYAASDRGPGGGVISYEPRVNKFTLDTDPKTGAISNFQLQETILLKQPDGRHTFNGLRPDLDSERHGGANNRKQGRSFDPEGLVVDRDGNLYISEEYGPRVCKFDRAGVLQYVFTRPRNLTPKDAEGKTSYGGTRESKMPPAVVRGRQDNRGFEGLAIAPDGTKLYAVMQDPLADEGPKGQGRFGRNLRIVEFDVSSRQPLRQFIYQLEPIEEINARIPGEDDDFKEKSQGRNLGVGAIAAINAHEFLVLERDNRGVGVDDPLGEAPVGSKRVYRIDISKATNVQEISLASSKSLPDEVKPVRKELLLDLAESLSQNGEKVFEKFEGLAVGPRLASGETVLILGTDNDYSVTQEEAAAQFEMYVNTEGKIRYTPLDDRTKSYSSLDDALSGKNADGALPKGYVLLPGYLAAFRVRMP